MTGLNDVNTTNLRIVVSVALFALYVVGAMGLSAIGHAPSDGVLYTLGTAILISMGLDVTQFRVKRKTHMVTPPSVMADDAGAPATAAMTPAPPARPGVVTIPRRPPDPRPGMTPMPDEGVDLGALVRELPPAPVPPPDETVPVTVPVTPSPSAPDGLTDAELADAYR